MAQRIVLVVIITFLSGSVEPLKYTEVVRTTYGPVRGEEVTSNGVHFKSFKGIPYAKAPIRELRFKAPQPPVRWRMVRNATKFGPVCHQPAIGWYARVQINIPFVIRSLFSNAQNMIESFVRLLQAREDCLSLNVYTTQLGDKDLKPVLVFVHGGAYLIGDSTDTFYGPEFLLPKDVVVVTFNYRLGVLGFLSTNTTETPGNWGLKDQVAALKWVQDNIVQFGGDPKRVTLYGQSAGASCVHFHMLSPLSKGLFHRAIVASGSVTCRWALNNQQERLSRRLAQLFGASDSVANNPSDRAKFLRKVNGKRLSDKQVEIYDEEISGEKLPANSPFAPVVEPPGTVGAFLTEDPNKLLAEGRFTKVPLMMGVTDLEGGVLFTGISKFHNAEDTRKVSTEACKILQNPLKQAIIKRNDCSKITKQLSDLYFGGKTYNSSSLNFVNMVGDLIIFHPVHVAQKWHARYSERESPVYFYYYTYDGEWSTIKNLLNLQLPGTVHGDDLNYIFNAKLVRLPRLAPTSSGHYNQERILDFYTNFMKYGNPTPSLSKTIPIFWEPAFGETLNTMYIGTTVRMERGAVTNRMAFLDSLYKKYIGTSLYE